MKHASRIFYLALICTLGACQEAGHPDFASPKLDLSEMNRPRVVDGETWTGKKVSGQRANDYQERVLRVDGLQATYRNGEGCIWTRNSWSFAPVLSWRNCPATFDGFQRINAVEGEIWPLRLGNRISYDVNGYDMSGRTWVGTRDCIVWDEVKVRTMTGTHETFVVKCNDPWMQVTWYVSPELRQVVMRRIYDKAGERITRWELEDVKRPGIMADPR